MRLQTQFKTFITTAYNLQEFPPVSVMFFVLSSHNYLLEVTVVQYKSVFRLLLLLTRHYNSITITI